MDGHLVFIQAEYLGNAKKRGFVYWEKHSHIILSLQHSFKICNVHHAQQCFYTYHKSKNANSKFIVQLLINSTCKI